MTYDHIPDCTCNHCRTERMGKLVLKYRDERNRYRDALLLWKRMMADPTYDMGEMVAEFDKAVNAAFIDA